MILHPEAQKRAQAEIDAVVGTGRLPNFDDRKSLPYVEALFREVDRSDVTNDFELTFLSVNALQSSSSSRCVMLHNCTIFCCNPRFDPRCDACFHGRRLLRRLLYP